MEKHNNALNKKSSAVELDDNMLDAVSGGMSADEALDSYPKICPLCGEKVAVLMQMNPEHSMYGHVLIGCILCEYIYYEGNRFSSN